MSATEDVVDPMAAAAAFEELSPVVDGRTLEILEHRRRTAIIRRRGWLVRRLLLTADVLGLVAAFFLAEFLVNKRDNAGMVGARAEILVFLASIPVWVVIAKVYGLYDRDEERTDHSTADDFGGVLHMVTLCTWLLWAFSYLTHFVRPTPPKLLLFWFAAIVLVPLGRAGARALARRSVCYLQNTVIVGAGDVGQLVAKKLLQHPEYGINLVGFVDDEPKERRPDLEHLALLGGKDRLRNVVRAFDIERVIVAFSKYSHSEILELIRSVKDREVQVDFVPQFFEVVGAGVDVHTVEGVPLVALPPARLSRSSQLLKRAFDLVGSVIGLMLLSPFFALAAIAIRLDSPGSIFFRQVRMGRGDRTFRIVKFRTMTADADERKAELTQLNKHASEGGDPRMFKIDDDPRVTRVGRLLRRFSLDELPQLWNVLRGEMSLVGPRPLILHEHAYVSDWAERRLDLRPGITGLWQVLGRDEIPFREMVQFDYLYVTTWSLAADVRLLLRTLPVVTRRRAGTGTTMDSAPSQCSRDQDPESRSHSAARL